LGWEIKQSDFQVGVEKLRGGKKRGGGFRQEGGGKVVLKETLRKRR